jgi:hypothetical protein
MGFIQPIGPRSAQPLQPRTELRTNISTEVMTILTAMGIKQLRSTRVQQGRHILAMPAELATLQLNHDQQNALHGLGLQNVLLATFGEDIDVNYKDKLKELHEHLLGEEQIALLRETFGFKGTPILLEDDNHNGVFLLQESVKELDTTLHS